MVFLGQVLPDNNGSPIDVLRGDVGRWKMESPEVLKVKFKYFKKGLN